MVPEVSGRLAIATAPPTSPSPKFSPTRTPTTFSCPGASPSPIAINHQSVKQAHHAHHSPSPPLRAVKTAHQSRNVVMPASFSPRPRFPPAPLQAPKSVNVPPKTPKSSPKVPKSPAEIGKINQNNAKIGAFGCFLVLLPSPTLPTRHADRPQRTH